MPAGVYLVQTKYVDNDKALGMMHEESFVDDYAKKEFVLANPPNARNALIYAIDLHRQMQRTNPLWGRSQKVDLGWCYAELSLLEGSSGNTSAASEHMSQARETLKEAGLQDMSETRIRNALQTVLNSNDTTKAEAP
jgi:hypothetical protein